MTKKTKQDNALQKLLNAATPKVLVDLILKLAASKPDVRRKCFEHLKKHVPLSRQAQNISEDEAAMSIWDELASDLDELDDRGGGDWKVIEYVGSLLYDLQKKFSGKQVGSDCRRNIINQVLPYIKSGNAGLDDMLYDVAYAACYDDNDLRLLAGAFEKIGDDWPMDHARRIYRQIGDRDRYLDLRFRKMIYGGDYHDLATFYWEAGEKEKSLQVAEEGLCKGKGRMDDLRQFLSERAEDSGDRQRYMELQFAQATDCLTLEQYQNFKKICTAEEWELFESRVLERLKKAWQTEQMKIRMHRLEYEEALAVLIRGGYPISDWDCDASIQVASQLENRFPEQILKYYRSGLGDLKRNAVRKEYARQAKLMAKIQHVLTDILHDGKQWRLFAGRVKRDNLKRPAFQEEFSGIVPGWRELNTEINES